jgi:hypothetical protein
MENSDWWIYGGNHSHLLGEGRCRQKKIHWSKVFDFVFCAKVCHLCYVFFKRIFHNLSSAFDQDVGASKGSQYTSDQTACGAII